MKFLTSLRNALSGNNKLDRKIRKFIFGVEELPKVSRRQKIIQIVSMVLLLYSGGVMGYIFGYTDGTGMNPFSFTTAQSVRPAAIDGPLTTIEVVKEFMESDKTDLRQYGEGFNSAEFGLLLARNAHWQGVPAQLVRLDFADGVTAHMVLAFPTSDAGWVFIEPQSDDVIYPWIGGHWLDKRIVAMWLFDPDRAWLPFEEFVGK